MTKNFQEKLTALRAELKSKGVDGFIIPKADEHQGEYVGPHSERLLWLTGFSGSAGSAIVLPETAATFVDGRYILQAQVEVDASLFNIILMSDITPQKWVSDTLKPGQKLAYDPWLLTERDVLTYKSVCEEVGASLIPLETNPIDSVWTDRPQMPLTIARIHPIEYAGKRIEDKISFFSAELRQKRVDATVITMTESVNWLFNIRGDDVAHVPVNFSFAILRAEGKPTLFINESKLTAEVRAHLGSQVEIKPYEGLTEALKELGQEKARVLIDPTTAPVKVIQVVEEVGGIVVRGDEICLLPKACKNDAELKGMRDCHVRDGAALTSFLCWVSKTAQQGGLTESDAADKLKEFRARQAKFREPSFSTISGTGAHGAIVHYRVSPESNAEIGKNDVYLVDSGGQYDDGCTDVTRTIAIGQSTQEQRDRFTRVLKGHISLATAKFPQGTSGSQLDALARQYLWAAGVDYGHGTGHGVGSALSIHEGPQRISNAPNTVALRPGMIVSNEPGYYKTNAFGIRIENLVIVVPANNIPGAEKETLMFETITFAPIDRNLIEIEMLTAQERTWLDGYHKQVREKLAPLVDDEVKSWLEKVTRPIANQ